MTLAFAHLFAASLMINTVPIPPQEWVRAYTAQGGKATFNVKSGLLSIAPIGGTVPGGILYPKAIAEVALVGVGVRNAHVSAVLKWPGVNTLYLPECTGIDDTVFPFLKASGLHEIHMHDVYVTASGVSRLSGSKTIRKINISTREEGKSAALKLTDMDQLKFLSLLNFNITSVALSDMPKLESIFDSSDLIKPKQLRRVEISKLPKLSSLDFALAPLDKLVIEDCKSLEEVRIAKGKLSDSDIAAQIRANPKLKIVRK